MNNKDLLVILNPRQEEECVNSLKSLDVPKVWIKNFNERGALERIMNIVNCDDIKPWSSPGPTRAPIFENYILISDDVIVKQDNIDLIVNNNDKYDVLSGYCNLNPLDPYVNAVPAVWQKKLSLSGTHPRKSDYPFYGNLEYTYENIQKKIKEDIFETYSIGFSFTSFKRHVLQEYGLQTYGNRKRGGASDHNISYKIVEEGKYKMFIHKHCYFQHLKLKSFRIKGDQKIVWEI